MRSSMARRRGIRTMGDNSGISSPLQIAGLTAWWDFSDITTLWKDAARTSPVTADGDNILGVTDKSGAGRHLAATIGPDYTVGIQNGRAVARHTAGDQYLTVTPAADVSRTVFFAGRLRAAASPSLQHFLWSNSVSCLAYSGNPIAQNLGFSHGPTAFGGGIDVQTATVYVVRGISAASADLYGGGGSPNNTDPHPNWMDGTQLRVGGGDVSNWDMFEIIMYDSTLSVADINLVGQYFDAKWGVTWSTAS